MIPSSDVGQGDDVYEVMSGKSNPGTGNVDSVLSLSDVIPSLRLDQADDTYEVMNGDNGKADGNARSNATTNDCSNYNSLHLLINCI